MKKQNRSRKLLSFLRLQDAKTTKWTLSGTAIGIIMYILLDALTLPYYKLMGLLTIQIDLAIIVIPTIAVFCGPLAGFLVGLLGSLGTDIIYTHQIIAFGGINLAFGALGFITGIPHYTKDEGFSREKRLGKLIIFTSIGFLVMIIGYLASLILIAHQNFAATLLYNFLPFFSVSLISLLIIAPVVIRLVDMIIKSANVDLTT